MKSILAILILSLTAFAQTRPVDEAASDSLLASDSLAVERLAPLSGRFGNRAALLDATRHAGDLWLSGDSCLVARLAADTTLTALSAVDDLPLGSLVSHKGKLYAAGSSGRVFVVESDSLFRVDTGDTRDISDLASNGNKLMLCGEEGLLARLGSGSRFQLLDAPVEARGYCLHYALNRWYLGMAGGRLYQSIDDGDTWELVWRDSKGKAIIDLDNRTSGELLALTRDGRLFEMDAMNAAREIATTGEEAIDLYVSAAGDIFLCSYRGHVIQVLPDRQTVLSSGQPYPIFGLSRWKGLVAISGDRRLFRLDSDSSTLLALQARRHVVEELLMAEVGDTVPTDIEQQNVSYSGPRLYHNMLETDARCTTTPTRLRQLIRSYHPAPRQGINGRVVLALDLSTKGQLEESRLLDESPAGLGFGKAALDVVANLSFTPAFGKDGIVTTRMLYAVHFPADDNRQEWEEPTPILDSLLSLLPAPASSLSLKELYKEMDYPSAARRFVWEGDVTVEYLLAKDGTLIRPTVLSEPEERYEFGKHALRILPDLGLTLPDSVQFGEGQLMRVVQDLHFDRRLKKDVKKARVSRETLLATRLALPVDTVAVFEPGLEQLEWLVNDLLDSTAVAAWGEQRLTIILGPDGRTQSIMARALSGLDADVELLNSLGWFFTWGRAAEDTGSDDRDTLFVNWEPQAFEADSVNMPVSLRPLLEGVLY